MKRGRLPVVGLLFVAAACEAGPFDGEVAQPTACVLPVHRPVQLSSYLDEAVGTLNSPSASDFAFSLSVDLHGEGAGFPDQLVSSDVVDLLDRLARDGRTTSLQRLDQDGVLLLVAFGSGVERDRAYCELAGDDRFIAGPWTVEIVDVSMS